MTVSPKTKHQFAKDFLWGAATAAHQVEGGNHNQWTVWELEHAKSLAKHAKHDIGGYASWPRFKNAASEPSNYVSGEATDHYNQYKIDFDLIEKMNMNAFRFSVEWSRIEPEMGVWDVKAINHYKVYIAELLGRGITPMMTLFHFTLPVWFAQMGGFERRSNIKYFVRFVDRVMQEFGRDVPYIITINEPDVYTLCSYVIGMWPPMQTSRLRSLLIINNLASAHNRAAKVIKKHAPRIQVSVAKHCAHFYAEDGSRLSRIVTAVINFTSDDVFLHRVRRRLDFVGLNYYRSFAVRGFSVLEPLVAKNDLNWDMRPRDIQKVLERLAGQYKLPIMITENGLADGDDNYRKWWLQETFDGMRAATKHGVKLRGYFHWSLTDNFEWSYGRWPQFGLAKVDYSAMKRELRPSATWLSEFIKHERRV